jgi:uncharacterized membrane protein (UPF0127 family)
VKSTFQWELDILILSNPFSMSGPLGIFFSFVVVLSGSIEISATVLKVQQSTVATGSLAIISTPKGDKIFAEIADTPAKRAKGLMGRTNLAPDRGMLFIFSETGQWTFWMKNTKLSLDIIWLNPEGKVVHLASNVPICTRTDEGCPRYHPSKKALYALELGGGMAERLGIHRGTELSIALP